MKKQKVEKLLNNLLIFDLINYIQIPNNDPNHI